MISPNLLTIIIPMLYYRRGNCGLESRNLPMISQSMGRGARVHIPLCQTLSGGASSCHVAKICSGSPGFTPVFLPQSGKMSQVLAPRGGFCPLRGLHRSEIIKSSQPNSANASGSLWRQGAAQGRREVCQYLAARSPPPHGD